MHIAPALFLELYNAAGGLDGGAFENGTDSLLPGCERGREEKLWVLVPLNREMCRFRFRIKSCTSKLGAEMVRGSPA